MPPENGAGATRERGAYQDAMRSFGSLRWLIFELQIFTKPACYNNERLACVAVPGPSARRCAMAIVPAANLFSIISGILTLGANGGEQLFLPDIHSVLCQMKPPNSILPVLRFSTP